MLGREGEREREMIEKTKKDFYWFLFVYKIFKNTLKLNFSQQKRHQQGEYNSNNNKYLFDHNYYTRTTTP